MSPSSSIALPGNSTSVSSPRTAGGLRRVALVVSRSLPTGAAANVAALLMGQLAARNSAIYAEDVPVSLEGDPHAAIQHSTVILRASAGQLATLAERMRDDAAHYCAFSSLGQSLNNEYAAYRRRLTSEPVEIIGIGLFGDDARVRETTKKYSLLT